MLMLPAPGSPRSLACYCSILPAHGYYEHKAQPVWIEYHFDKGWKRVGGIYPRSCPKWTCLVTLIASLILARNMLLWWVCLLVHLNLHLHVQSGGSREIEGRRITSMFLPWTQGHRPRVTVSTETSKVTFSLNTNRVYYISPLQLLEHMFFFREIQEGSVPKLTENFKEEWRRKC